MNIGKYLLKRGFTKSNGIYIKKFGTGGLDVKTVIKIRVESHYVIYMSVDYEDWGFNRGRVDRYVVKNAEEMDRLLIC